MTDEITLLSTYRARETEASFAEQATPVAAAHPDAEEAAPAAVLAQLDASDGTGAELPAETDQADPANEGAGATLLAFTRVLVSPARALRSVSPSSWRTGVTVIAAVAFARTAAFVATDLFVDGAPASRVLPAAVASLVSPLVYVAVGTAVLLAMSAIARSRLRTPIAVSLASLAAAPVALQALLQTLVMGATRHAIHPTGIIGLVAPDAPVLARLVLAPIDLFAVWTTALVIVAAVVSARDANSVAQSPADSASLLDLDES